MTADGWDLGDGRPLRVAQIITGLPRGGAQATVVASADLGDHGIEVTILAGAPDGADGGGDPDSYWGHPSLAGATVIPIPSLVRRPAPLADLRTLVRLVRWLRANRPDVVHTHSSKAGVLGRLAAAAVGIPVAHTVHGWGPLHARRRWAAALAAAVERFLARRTAALVVVGTADLRLGLARRIGRPGHYRIIRSGIDVAAGAAAADDRQALRQALGVDDRAVVGMVARLAHPKDHATLVAAFRRAAIPDSILLLVGDGPERASIEQAVDRAGLGERVRFLGGRDDAERIVAAFDVAVLSSQWEGLPRAVVEAAAARVPVIASDVGSVADLVDDGVSGRLVPAGDVEALTAALADRFADPERYAAMAEVAASRVEEFSEEEMRRELAELWRRLAGHGHGAPATPGPSGPAAPGSPDSGTVEAPPVEAGGGDDRGRRSILAER